MLDCGIHPGFSGFASLPYLDETNVAEIDVALITHFHLDHCAAVPYLLQKTSFKVGSLTDRSGSSVAYMCVCKAKTRKAHLRPCAVHSVPAAASVCLNTGFLACLPWWLAAGICCLCFSGHVCVFCYDQSSHHLLDDHGTNQEPSPVLLPGSSCMPTSQSRCLQLCSQSMVPCAFPTSLTGKLRTLARVHDKSHLDSYASSHRYPPTFMMCCALTFRTHGLVHNT